MRNVTTLVWAALAAAWAFAVQFTLEPSTAADPRAVAARILMTLGALAIGGICWLLVQSQSRTEIRERLAFRNHGHQVCIALAWALLAGFVPR
ncbi:hypothetical protein [Cupriavidus sp. IK-TO18]|uniref:hypothetical protein n=1 Tax=Cupriavidus sp. IK-TO18 TaxID=2782182 RepID=UPI00189B9928|nr:hypothetical protein [Cupriavidus sp. IK-TO18]MBF6990937.1 hypothetical protein [Cupriavidus sp. IK-TO18]